MKQEHQELCEALQHCHQLMVANGFSTDPRKWRETSASLQTGQEPSTAPSGPDCYDTTSNGDREAGERKSSVGELKAAYTGISWHPSWEKQLQYILEKKIKNCKYHYFDNFNETTGDLQEVWRMDADTLLKLKLPSLKEQWEDRMKRFRNGNPPKDPRLSFTLGRRIIEKYGKRIK